MTDDELRAAYMAGAPGALAWPWPEGLRAVLALGQQAAGEPVTLADVLDALNVFNRPKPSEDDGPWEAGHFIRVDYLPDFINTISKAWFPTPPAAARVPLTDEQIYAGQDAREKRLGVTAFVQPAAYWFHAGARFSECAHGITAAGQEGGITTP